MSSKWIEAILFIPAQLFNRIIIVLPLGICILLGAARYDNMLTVNGFKPLDDKVSDEMRLSFGFCFFVLFGVCLLMMVCCTQLMKYTIRRERPKRRVETQRMRDLRVLENGTYSMPSGDSSAAAVFCLLVAIELEMPLVYILMPLVMLGRVYY